MRDERVPMLQESGVPFVLIGRTEDTAGLSYVDIDFDRTVRDAVDHLVGLGHRRSSTSTTPRPRSAAGTGRRCVPRTAFEETMRGHGLEPLMIPAEDTAAGRQGRHPRCPGAGGRT